MLWRLHRSPPSDLPIWVRDTELETYNDQPDEKYTFSPRRDSAMDFPYPSHHGGNGSENNLMAFPSEESTRSASKSDRLPSLLGESKPNGANDIC